MDGEDPRFLKKRVSCRSIELDPAEDAVIVHYEIEATVLNEQGEAVHTDRKQGEKKVRVKTLNESTDIHALAEEVAAATKLISKSRLPALEEVLQQMLKRKMQRESAPDEEADMRVVQQRQRKMMEARFDADIRQREEEEPAEPLEPARMEDIDDYLEKLYEDNMDERIKGTLMIMQLARNPENLGYLIQNEAVLSALSRTLREEGKKSVDLTTNIISVFFSLSHYTQFHPIITQYQVGDVVMRQIDLEVQRHELRRVELQKKLREDPASAANEEKKFKFMARKQEKLLYVCFHILLNLAEDVVIEVKMRKRKIITYLSKMLDRKNTDLLILIVTFLKKLSIVKENKNEMHESSIVEKLIKFVPTQNEHLLNIVLRLLMNLSFDPAIREDMTKHGLMPKLVTLMRIPTHLPIVLRILYHLSLDEKVRSLFSCTDAVTMSLELIVNTPQDASLSRELAALAINLATHAQNCEILAEANNLSRLIQRAFRTRDALLMKAIRNLASHDLPTRANFARYIPDLMMLAKKCDNGNLLVEVLGTLAELTIPEYDFAAALHQQGFLDYLHRVLSPGFAEDDIVLEAVRSLGAFLEDGNCAPLLARTPLIKDLCDLVIEKQEDDDIVLQIAYVFYQLIMSAETRGVLLHHTQIVPFLVDLLTDSNPQIRGMADAALDTIMEFDAQWARRIRQKKYEIHNLEWLDIVEAELSSVHESMPATAYDLHDSGLQLRDDEEVGDWGDDSADGSDTPSYQFGRDDDDVS